MSLHALAGHMATKGRGGDSMLVHMTPGEVQALQALAERHGGTLTINPETGQPEANFLKKILPMVAGFALGPAGFGLVSSAMGAGALVGGITALSTGSLSRGLMAGLGAYGGASLGAGLANMGSSAVGADALAAANASADPIMSLTAAKDMATATGAVAPTGFSALTEGAKAAFNDPTAFVQGMGGMGKTAAMGLAAISPMMADEGVQTTTPKQDTGNIRRFSFDRFGQTYTPQGVFPAAGYTGMAQGGIVALANGGMPPTINQDYVNQLVREAAQQAGGTLSFADATNAAKNLGISPDMLSSAASNTGLITGAPAPVAGPAAGTDAYNSMVGNFFNNPNITAADVSSAMSTYGLNQADVTNAMRASGLSNAAQYSAFQPDVGVPSTPMGGLAGLSSNINAALGNFQGVEGRAPTREEAEAAMALEGYNELDFIRATGMTLDDYFKQKKKVPPIVPITTATNLPGGVSGGGNTVVNPNGTITTAPNIPGRPEGGFTGMGQLKDIYTQRGGSLGYTNPAPKTMEEFEQRFNRQTGDSLAAYEYLMGKGANPATQQRVGEIARPYSEAIVGIPAAAGRPNQKYIYQDGRYVENPNYAPVTYDTKGNRVVGMTSAEVLKGFQALPDQTDDAAIFDWVGENQISLAQLAAAMGISVSEAQRRMNAIGKTKGATINSAGYISDGGDSADAGGGGGSGGGVGGAGGPGSTSAADPSDFGGMATGGQVKRMALGGLGSLAKGGVAELPDGAFVVPARITSELGNGSTNAGAQKLFAMEQRLLGKNAQPVNLGRYSGGGNLVRGKGDGVSDSVPATIGGRQPARIADGESVVSRKAVEKLGDGSIEAGARKLYAMMDRVQKARGKTTGKNRVAANTRADKYLPA
jgi:hypothetical protein